MLWSGDAGGAGGDNDGGGGFGCDCDGGRWWRWWCVGGSICDGGGHWILLSTFCGSTQASDTLYHRYGTPS